jgi:hypothetical protein
VAAIVAACETRGEAIEEPSACGGMTNEANWDPAAATDATESCIVATAASERFRWYGISSTVLASKKAPGSVRILAATARSTVSSGSTRVLVDMGSGSACEWSENTVAVAPPALAWAVALRSRIFFAAAGKRGESALALVEDILVVLIPPLLASV